METHIQEKKETVHIHECETYPRAVQLVGLVAGLFTPLMLYMLPEGEL